MENVYANLSRTEYSWKELQERPFPAGVDPAKIEHYLSNNTFKVINAYYILETLYISLEG